MMMIRYLMSVSFLRSKLNHCIMSLSTEKSRNIEIKAYIDSKEEFNRRIQIAKELTESDGETIPQRDVFFNTTNGRLKLRFLQVRYKMVFNKI